MPQICRHNVLTFGSGDHYVICEGCWQYWAIEGEGKNPQHPQPEEIQTLQFEKRMKVTVREVERQPFVIEDCP